MSTPQVFLIAIGIIFSVPYLVWRLGRTDHYAPLVVVQIIAGILLGPGVLGRAFPAYYATVFSPSVVHALNGLAWWGVMVFVWLAGVELDLRHAWWNRRDSLVTATCALITPLLCGSVVALGLVAGSGWMGRTARPWQFVLGVGMSCAVTALPILILLMEKLAILRQPLGLRILRYASLDDVAIWGVLALILMDWQRVFWQVVFLAGFGVAAVVYRLVMRRLPESDRWYAGLIGLAVCAFASDISGLHFMVGAFLAGAVTDADWFDRARTDLLRHHVLLVVMPVFFLSTGLRTGWDAGGGAVFLAALALLAASVVGKLAGVRVAAQVLGWARGDAFLVGWLLQTKALIMIIFSNILLDVGVITGDTFTALLLMAVGSTMLTVPVVAPRLARRSREAAAAH